MKIPRYTVSTEFLPGVNHATLSDILVIAAGPRPLYVVAAYIFAIQAGSGNPVFRLIRRTSADTGGTSQEVAVSRWDSASPSAGATARVYTAHPTAVGSNAEIFRTSPIGFDTGKPLANLREWQFNLEPLRSSESMLTVRPGEFLALNVSGLDAAASVQCSIHFNEVI